jgi:hypothetical protein
VTGFDVYVTVAGHGTTGDGSVGSPFQTVTRALQEIKPLIQGVTVTVNVGTGTFVEQSMYREFSRLFLLDPNSKIIIQGEATEVLSSSTFNSPAGDVYEFSVTPTFSTTEDAYLGNFVKTGTNWYPIGYNNTTDTV